MIVAKQSVGIDVSKDDFHVRILRRESVSGKFFKHRGIKKFDNTLSGFKKFNQWLHKYTDRSVSLSLVMEATGVYHEELAYFLHQQEYRVSIELPNKVSQFAKSYNLHSKTDILDAEIIALLGLERHLDAWQPPSKSLRKLRLLTRQHQSITESKTMFKNQLHAVRHSADPMPEVVMRYKTIIAVCEQELAAIDKSIKQLIELDEKLDEVIGLLVSIPGIALKTASAIAAETGCFQLFNSRSQLIKYSGMDIVDKQSGSSVRGKPRLSKRGNARVRRALYMPSIQFVNKDDVFGKLYRRVLERTGIPKKALVAVQRKLLIVMYGVVKNGTPYDTQRHLARHKKEVGDTKFAYSDSIS